MEKGQTTLFKGPKLVAMGATLQDLKKATHQVLGYQRQRGDAASPYESAVKVDSLGEFRSAPT